MFRLLTDTATLRSALRALTHGSHSSDAGPDRRQLVDIDIANLAKLVDDIVLGEQVLYLPNQRALQGQDLSLLGDALKPVELPEALLELCVNEARLRMSRLATAVDLFNLVGLIPQSFWTSQLHATLSYLVFQGLGVREKYSDLMEFLCHHRGLGPAEIDAASVHYNWDAFSLSEPSVSNLQSPQLADWAFFLHRICEDRGIPEVAFADDDKGQFQAGHPDQISAYPPGVAISTEMQGFASQILWLYFRTHFYGVVGQAIGATYAPHSLRAPLTQHAVLGSEFTAIEDKRDLRSVRRQLMNFIKAEAGKGVAETLQFFGARVESVGLPATFYHVALKVSRPDQIIPIAYDVRDSSPAKRFRDECKNVVDALQRGDVKHLSRLRTQLERLAANIRREYGASDVESAEAKIGYGPLQFTGKFRVPPILYKQFFPFHGHLAFLRNIYHDLARVAALCLGSEINWTRPTRFCVSVSPGLGRPF